VKVLIVDDNHRIRKALSKHLAQLGTRLEAVVECEDGESAIGLFTSLHPDWVLMDIGLPGINGLEATRRILRADPNAKVLIVTQYNEREYREEAGDIGAKGYVLKENLDSIPEILLADIASHPT
jgi:DNA-binding NarL/FixJ family response regulator